jgi:hypothetical protein
LNKVGNKYQEKLQKMYKTMEIERHTSEWSSDNSGGIFKFLESNENETTT